MEKYVRVTLDQKKYNFFDHRHYIYKELNGLKDDLGYIFPFEKENQVRDLFKQVSNLNILTLPVPEESCHKYEIFKRQCELDNKRIAYKKKKKSFDSLPPNQQGESEQALIFHTKQQIESLEASITVAKNMQREVTNAKIEFQKQKEQDQEQMNERCEKVLNFQKPTQIHDISYLPTLLRDYVRFASERSNTDPILVLAPLLNSISGFFRNHCTSEGTYFQKLHPLLWQTCIMPSGSFKTTTLNLGKAIALRREREKNTEFGLNSVLLPSSMTYAALKDALASGEGGVTFHSELKSWFRSMDQSYNSELKPFVTDIFDVPEHLATRTKQDGERDLNSPFYGIYGVSTAEWLTEEITEKDIASGFFYRLLIHMPVCSGEEIPPALPTQNSTDYSAFQQLEKNLYQHCTGIECQAREYTLSERSVEVFKQYHEELYLYIRDLPAEMKKKMEIYPKRWSPYILKIAMILQPFFEFDKNRGSFNTHYFQISPEAISAAATYMASTIAGTTLLFKTEIGVDSHQRECDKLLKYIARSGGTVRRKEILRNYRIKGGSKALDELERTLEESGRVTIMKSEKTLNNIYKVS